MAYRGIIFDFNGVLWWDQPLQEQSWNEMAVALRGHAFSAEEMAAEVHGRTNQDTLAYLLGRPVAGAELAALSERKETRYRALCLALGPAFRLSPGAVDLLAFLARHGIARTIATSSPAANVAFFVRHLALATWFAVDRIAYDRGTFAPKPAPDIYLAAAAGLGLPPAACVVVEDSRSGLQAAVAAGSGYVVALGPAAHHAALARLPGVDRVIPDLGALPAAELFLAATVTPRQTGT